MSDWFKEWFSSEEYLNVYSHRNADEAKHLIDLILAQINLPAGSKILDAACGAGRYSKILIDRGFDVVGFDLSKTLLKIAKNSINHGATNSNYFCSDIRNVCLKRKFDLIINLFTSFGYFENDEENSKFIFDSFDLISDGGHFVLDYLNPEFVKNHLVPFSKKNIGSKEILEERQILNGRVEKQITIIDNSGNKKYKESVKLYSLNEIEAMFSNVGFKNYKLFGNYEGSSYNENLSERILIIFKK